MEEIAKIEDGLAEAVGEQNWETQSVRSDPSVVSEVKAAGLTPMNIAAAFETQITSYLVALLACIVPPSFRLPSSSCDERLATRLSLQQIEAWSICVYGPVCQVWF